MKKSTPFFIIIFMAMTLFGCCKKHQETVSETPSPLPPKTKAGPPVYLYKTKADYTKNIPVVLGDDKNSILAFPDIGDIYYQGTFSYPTPLEDGYLLDNRGIEKNTAFLSYTYEEYSKLAKTPDVKELFSRIIDNDPFSELYYGGTRYQYKDLVPELNALIKKKDFSRFRKEK